jgi:hypothetical protein
MQPSFYHSWETSHSRCYFRSFRNILHFCGNAQQFDMKMGPRPQIAMALCLIVQSSAVSALLPV